MKRIIIMICVLASTSLFAQTESIKEHPSSKGIITKVVYVPSIAEQMANGTLIPSLNPSKPMEVNLKHRDANKVVPGKGFPKGNDPLIASQRSASKYQGRTPDLVFEADQNSNITPTDPTGAVGPNHYIAAWNSGFRIFDKEGNPLTSEASLGTVLTGNTTGDPIILYDHEADRFIITEFDSNPNGFEMAVCEGPDPVNDGWFLYLNQFETGAFPDYTKFSIWHDAYYITANVNNGNNGDRVWAVERDKMLAGAPAQYVGFPLAGITTSGFYSPHGFNWTAGASPTGDHTVVYLQDDAWGGVNDDHVKLWDIAVNWSEVNASTITGPTTITTSDFTSVFDGGSFANLEQPNGVDMDALQATIMNQAQWRKFPGYNSALFNFVVDTDGSGGELAGVRWFELRQDAEGMPWSIYQEGTYISPVPGRHAFSASMAMDDNGNIGMAYTTVSTEDHIAIYYTGRYNGDPLNVMTVDETLLAQGSNDAPGTRVADYVHMTLDPADGKSFWHIAEYFDPGRDDVVSVFKLAPDLANDMGALSIDNPSNGVLSATEPIGITVRNYGIEEQVNFPVSYRIDNGPWVMETMAGPVASAANVPYTFTQTADLSIVGQTYTITAAVSLGTDENMQNDTISIEVTNLFPDDLGVIAITAPVSTPDLSAAEAITVTIRNFGGAAQSNFDVSYSVNGSSAVMETVTGPLDGDDEMSFTFSTPYDMSALGTYDIDAYTSLTGDTDDTNDLSSVTVEKEFCQPETDCTVGDGFQLVEITTLYNPSDCESNGYGDFTAMTAALNAGTTHELTLTTGYGNQYVKVWIDFNDDFAFTADELIIIDYVMGAGSGPGTYTETIDFPVPAAATLGDHIMRVKSNWDESVPTDACEDSEFGETEDYTASINPVGIDEHVLGNNSILVREIDADQFVFELSTETTNEDLKISIIDINGQTVAENWVLSQNGLYTYTVDMSSAASGTYLARFWNQKASKIAKFVVK